mgnify:CR=1 FL=1
MGLEVWDKPAQACLSSRIPYGTTVTVVEENAIATNSTLGTLSGTISGDNVLFQVTMGSSSSATVTLIKELITV